MYLLRVKNTKAMATIDGLTPNDFEQALTGLGYELDAFKSWLYDGMFETVDGVQGEFTISELKPVDLSLVYEID